MTTPANPKNETKPVRDLDGLLQAPGHLVRRLHQICTSVFLQNTAEYNLTAIQYIVLVTIERYPGIDLVSLGKIVAHDRQTISNVVSRLSGRSLIDRRDRNKRAHALFLTDKAREILHILDARIEEMDEIILRPLNHAERKRFLTLLQRMVNENNELSRAPKVDSANAAWLEKPLDEDPPRRKSGRSKKIA